MSEHGGAALGHATRRDMSSGYAGNVFNRLGKFGSALGATRLGKPKESVPALLTTSILLTEHSRDKRNAKYEHGDQASQYAHTQQWHNRTRSVWVLFQTDEDEIPMKRFGFPRKSENQLP